MRPLSPFRISQKINLPDFSFSPLHQKEQKHSASQLALARGQVLALKDDKQYQSALKEINTLINQHPSDVRNYQIKGELTFQLKMYQEALETYDQLLALTTINESKEINSHNHNPTLLELKKCRALYYYNKALCLLKLQRPQQAADSLKKAISLNKHKQDSYICLAQCYRTMGQMEKVNKIYDRLLESNPGSSVNLLKILNICKKEKDAEGMLKYIERGEKYWKVRPLNEAEDLLVSLNFIKCQAFILQQKHQQAINTFTHLLALKVDQSQLLLIYSKLALCYDHLNNFDRAASFYQKMLSLDPLNLHTVNNLANLQIRNKQPQAAADLLTSSINQHISSIGQPFLMVMLRCHRVIAFTQLGRISEAAEDLGEIASAIEQIKLKGQKEVWTENYRFVRYITHKYKNSINQLSRLKQEEFRQQKDQIIELERELVRSISCQLEIQEQRQKLNNPAEEGEKNQVNLQKLQNRIDRLYSQIITLKKKTMQQHEQNAQKVHKRIEELDQKLTKKEVATNALENQLKQLRMQSKEIFQLVQSNRKYTCSQLTSSIKQLQQDKKEAKASYIQQMYWILNAYFLAIRLIANQLVPSTNTIHSNKLSSFFSKFKSIFSTLSHIPYIGAVCQGITVLVSFYLSEQSQMVYSILNQLITNNYCLERDLQCALQEALIQLSRGDYIEDAIKEHKMHSLNKEMSLQGRTYNWFKGKKKQLMEKIVRLENKAQKKEDELLEDLVVEDVSLVLVYLVKNRYKFTKRHPNPDIIDTAIRQALTLDRKHKEVHSLYTRDRSKSTFTEDQGQGCTKCMIYNANIPSNIPQLEPSTNQVMDSLLGQAIKTNDMRLFEHALGRMTFDF